LSDDDRKVSRQVGRRLANWTTLVLSLGVLGVWCYFGYYELQPGEHAVILRMGRYARTVTSPGPKLHLPPPLESHEIVRVAESQREEFGRAQQEPESPEKRLEAGIQTKDNNVVLVQFSVQYRIKDAFFSRYRIASPRETVRDAAQAAIREVIGNTDVDGVLYSEKALVASQTRQVLQQMLDRYESGLEIDEVNLEDVQAPDAVKEAFSDVVSAAQDRETRINQAQGYANEVLPQARGKASELRESAQGYHDAKIAQATGEAQRFSALVAEYHKAPEVTRKRLYLETMEAILPDVQKVIIQPGTPVLPYLPIGPSAPTAAVSSPGPSARAAPSPAPSAKAEPSPAPTAKAER
jgi:membrane protease subunit HflK